MTETQWRLNRKELYAKLEGSAEHGLNRDAVAASRWGEKCRGWQQDFGADVVGAVPNVTRELFSFDNGRAVPKEFSFKHEDDAVNVVCAEIPHAAAQSWINITNEILQALGDATGSVGDVYVSDPDIMHVTLFYTSHPDDLAPRGAYKSKSDRLEYEIKLLREMATQFEPIRVKPVKLVLAASGAILLLMECLPNDSSLDTARNAGSGGEFSIDLLRQTAQQQFPFVSTKSPQTIIHTTLARVLSADAFDDAAISRVRAFCHRISQQWATDGADASVVDKLWYVDESHYIRPTGHTTTISLGSNST